MIQAPAAVPQAGRFVLPLPAHRITQHPLRHVDDPLRPRGGDDHRQPLVQADDLGWVLPQVG
jgi:hypothetical protein